MKNAFQRKREILQAAVIIIMLSLFFVACQCLIQNGLTGNGALSILACPLLPLCNAIPPAVIICVVFCVTNRIWAGFLSAAIPLYALLTVNYFKVYFRAETLSAHDFSLFSEAASIVKGYDFPVPVSVIAALILSTAVFILLFKFARRERISIKSRILLLFISAAVGVGSYFSLYSSGLYKALPSFANEYNDVSVAAHKGFLFTFLSSLSGYEYKMPDGYNIHSVPPIGEKDPDDITPPETPVNVIAVMSEAFFDMAACENVEFYDGQSPTPNLDRLKSDSLWGHILVPGYAGSTASTEFEFLTGINISLLDSSMPVVYKTHVTQNAYGIARMFRDMGYETEAFHPGDAWFYNRKAVYPRLGFDNAYFSEDFEYSRDDLVNYYVSDKITADKIISEYDDYLRSSRGNGYFSFAVTIQNHGPYSTDEPDNPRIVRSADIDDEGYAKLCNYANGLHDADELLGAVCDYIETVDAPTVVVFFGDHLPYFDADGKYLEWLGLDVNSDTPRALENRYSTPYIVHGNKAFRNTLSGGAEKNVEHISSSFLAVEALNYMGIDYSPYFKAISDIHDTIQEISGSFFIADGKHSSTLTQKQRELLKNYEYLSFWALREYKRPNE